MEIFHNSPDGAPRFSLEAGSGAREARCQRSLVSMGALQGFLNCARLGDVKFFNFALIVTGQEQEQDSRPDSGRFTGK